MRLEKLDRDRCEGSYVSTTVYPSSVEEHERLVSLVGNIKLYVVERVNGDCSVDSIMLTYEEARNVVQRLIVELNNPRTGTDTEIGYR